MSTRERCKLCGRFNPLGFTVPDEIWEASVPEEFRNRVLCIMCFDDCATENGVLWSDHPVEWWPWCGARQVMEELEWRK